MKNIAIEFHKPESVRRLGPVNMRKDYEWSQIDSDTLAHFIQVSGQISQSSWLHKECKITLQGDKSAGSFPDMESFVFAAVYFRQLFSEQDRLFIDACDRYIRAVDSPLKAGWLHHEQHAALKHWTAPTLMVKECTTEELFNAMMYGTHLVHSLPKTWEKYRKSFRKILESTPKERLLFEMHSSLKIQFNYVSSAASVIYQDYSNWVHTGQSPAPDVMWHKSVFLPQV